jgi:predicted amidohydrolase
MKLAGIQSDIVWEDPPANFSRLAPWIQAAAGAGAGLVVLPEMFACGFSMAAARLAESPGGPATQFLVDQARRHNVHLCGSLPERPAGADKPFNTLVLASPSGQVARYRKIHPFTFAGEHHHYGAGEDFVTVTIDGVRCTLFVCYDLRFSDEFFATAPHTDLHIVAANWPEARRHHWTALLTARAIENQAYVAGVNRVGDGGGLHYTGDSRIVDPWGETLAAAAAQPTLILADVDAKIVADARETFPVLKDRR